MAQICAYILFFSLIQIQKYAYKKTSVPYYNYNICFRFKL